MDYFDLLTEEKRRLILVHFNRDINSLQDDLEAIKEWFKKQPHLPEIPSDGIITNFLILNKFHIEKVKEKIDLYYSIRRKVPEVFNLLNPSNSDLLEYADINYWIPLPKLTPDLCRVVFFKLTSSNSDLFSPLMFFAWTLSVAEIRLIDDACITNIVVIDLGNCGLGHLTKTTPFLVKKASTIIDKVYASAMKGMHFINAPPLVDNFIRILKSVVSPKLAGRFFVHDTQESLFNSFPKDIIPSDYGGTEKSLKELNEDLKKRVLHYQGRFAYLDQMIVDESKRPGKPMNDDILGFHGNFKKLSVD